MKLFLDSSAVIELFRNNRGVVSAIEDADEVYTGSLCAYEVLVGERYVDAKGTKSHYKEAAGFFETAATLPFDYDDAKKAAGVMAALSSKGKKVPEMDALIAAQAQSLNLTVLTKDARHFDAISRETGLKVKEIA